MTDFVPKCPHTKQIKCLPQEEHVMYYHIKHENVGDKFYEYINGSYSFIGEYTGYATRPTHKSPGRIQLENSNSSKFIACKAMYCPDIGWVITEYLEN